MAQTTPLYQVTSQAGGLLQEVHGWRLPAHYGDATAEYWQADRDVALFDISHHGQVDAVGAEAGRFLHNLCTNDVLKLVPGSGCEAFLTTAQAKIVGFVVIYKTAAAFHIDAGPGQGARVAAHLDRYIVSEQVEIIDRTPELAVVHLAGPRANDVVGRVFQTEVAWVGELQFSKLPFQDLSYMIRRHSQLGLPGYDLIGPASKATALWEALQQAGAGPAGTSAFEAMRIEAGTPVFGQDIDETNLPQEVGRTEKAISFTKGCYIGQETVARIRTYGHVNRSLVGLKFAGSQPARHGDKLFKEATEVGLVGSSAFSPRLGQAIGLAYVRRGNEKPGTLLQVRGADLQLDAEVSRLPLVE
jgi:folate-binding protein YgfZ